MCSWWDQEKYSGPPNSWLYEPLNLAQVQVCLVIRKFGANLLHNEASSMFWVDVKDNVAKVISKIDWELENDDEFVCEIFRNARKNFRTREKSFSSR